MESYTKQACYTKLSPPSFFPFSFWDRVSLTKLPRMSIPSAAPAGLELAVLPSTWTPSLLGCLYLSVIWENYSIFSHINAWMLFSVLHSPWIFVQDEFICLSVLCLGTHLMIRFRMEQDKETHSEVSPAPSSGLDIIRLCSGLGEFQD